ncbi:putative TIM-barrel enzyme [Stella humosa]|uniref:Putative TIM-barrel enzyme n=1 Tax=Stella humosa TaxID=94 RepID=A0A3N1L094_9PROT|nr:phosphoenolpyruvate hydrolase family protein [Stella humosa]ROP84008.1 putative TIM-barrel enzyme [Stella humosa]BBK33517.1 putative transcriptional regulatory protein y4pA [Stella humosa]
MAGQRPLPLKPARPGEILVGAAIGLGMTARAAVQGGADFLLVLNAGRLRVMGAASNAALLPIREANRFTDDFARHEILGRVSVPVLFGACVMDPTLDIDALVDRIAEAGYSGIANFPTSIHLDGWVRAALEDAGLGLAREVALLTRAGERGLATIGYARSKPEVERLLDAGVDMLCINFGWNAGGTMGIGGAMNLAAATDHARRMVALAKRADPGCLCFVEGGPIVQPKDAVAVCDASLADGYIGGSTLDRLPLEMSVMQATSAFKAASILRTEADDASRERSRIGGIAGLIGQSDAMAALVDQVAKLARTQLAVCITGEAGTGKTTVARAIHVASRSVGPFIVLDAGDADIDAKLFGRDGPGLMQTPDAHLVLENIERLAPDTIARLLDWIERGIFDRFLPQPQRPQHARLILTTARADARAGGFAGRLAAHVVEVPALRSRLEDVPLLARAILASQKRRRDQAAPRISADGMREFIRHGWPGNVRELAGVLARATALAPEGIIDAAIVDALIAPAGTPPGTDGPADERAWIMEALARHRFRRNETAQALGLSRKTLYNRMKRHGLVG